MIIDTTNKTIQVQDETLGEIVEQLQKMFPEEWKDYKLLTTVVNPTIIEKQVIRDVYPYRENPFNEPYFPYDPFNPWRITCDASLPGSGWRYGRNDDLNKNNGFQS